MRAALEAWLQRVWWRPRPGLVAWLLRPLSWLYAALRTLHASSRSVPIGSPVPVVVVGNLVVGGAGKTPVVIALVQALRERGWHPGVISRGFGGASQTPRAVEGNSVAAEVGDEPLLIRRRTGVPVWVGRRRADVAHALCRQQPEVDVLVSDDGLQHHALARAAEFVVFDERGVGNGLLLPAGPLREPLPPVAGPRARVLYTGPAGGMVSTRLPGPTLERRLGPAWPLEAWWRGDATAARPLHTLRGRPLLAVAGIGAPEKFFGMLEAQGLTITRSPQRDHATYESLPWPVDTADVVTTEKDAVKLARGAAAGPTGLPGSTRVWVVGLDLVWPAALTTELEARLHGRTGPALPATPPTARP